MFPFAVPTLVMVFATPPTRSVQSAKLDNVELAKVQPMLTPKTTEVAPATGFWSDNPLPSRITNAAEAEMSEPFTSIQRSLEPTALFPKGVHMFAQ
jgi:hypothetical protein